MNFQTTETVPTPDSELVLRSLETSLRELSTEVVRHDTHVTAYGIGPSPRARNPRDVATLHVESNHQTTTIHADVTFQASALLGGSPQDAVVRSKLDYVFQQLRGQLKVSQSAPPPPPPPAAREHRTSAPPKRPLYSAPAPIPEVQTAPLPEPKSEPTPTPDPELTPEPTSTLEPAPALEPVTEPPLEAAPAPEAIEPTPQIEPPPAESQAQPEPTPEPASIEPPAPEPPAIEALIDPPPVIAPLAAEPTPIPEPESLAELTPESTPAPITEPTPTPESTPEPTPTLPPLTIPLPKPRPKARPAAEAKPEPALEPSRADLKEPTLAHREHPTVRFATHEHTRTLSGPVLIVAIIAVLVACAAGFLFWAGHHNIRNLISAPPPAVQPEPQPPNPQPAAVISTPTPALHLDEPDPGLWLEHWADALRSTDPDAQAAFYANPVDRYLKQTHLDRPAITQLLKASIDARTPLWTVKLDKVTVEPLSDDETLAQTTVRVRLTKHFMQLGDSPSISEHFVRTILQLRRVDNQWRITSEQDLTTAVPKSLQ